MSRHWIARGLRTQGIFVVVVTGLSALVTLAVGWQVDAKLNGSTGGGPPHAVAVALVAAGVGMLVLTVAMVEFTGGIVDRLALAAGNAECMSSHQPLSPVAPSSRDMGRLTAGLEQTALMLGVQEADLRSALADAEEASRAKSDFLSRVSHELRTPLNAVLGFGQLLDLEPDLEPDQREAVDHIMRAGEHLLGLINEVLDVARIESKTIALEQDAVSVSDVFHEALELVGPLARANEISLHDDGLTGLAGLYVLADRQRLLQVLLNLLSNAIKYNHRGGQVMAACRQAEGGVIRLEVADSGIGVDLRDLDRLFAPFDRLGAEQTGIEGTGIGLSLSLHLVEAMGGCIAVDSAPGVGSTFAIELPATVGPSGMPSPAGGSLHLAEEVRRARSAEPRILDRQGRVLYIEDNLPNFTLVKRILAERGGIELMGAMQGGLGFEMARDHRPGLVLLDLHLPDTTGAEVLDRLRNDPVTRGLPVVVVSADATEASIRTMLAAGAVEYLSKPLDVQSLLRCVDDAFAPS